MAGVGPFSIHALVFLMALWLGWWTARIVARKILKQPAYQAAGSLMLNALLAGLVGARLGYIVQWWPEFQVAPFSMLSVWDGGFLWWVGLLVALAWIHWRVRGQRLIGRAAMVGVLLGTLVWVGAGYTLDQIQQRAAIALPTLPLHDLTGRSVELQAYQGRPVVVSLWATWCPYCRREMPAFERAQQLYPGVAFVMINQGETEQQVQAYLQKEGLNFSEMLLDPASQAMQVLNARVIPMTFFFNASGHLVRSHMGEMTLATLSSTLDRYFGQALQAESAGARHR